MQYDTYSIFIRHGGTFPRCEHGDLEERDWTKKVTLYI